MKRGKRGCSMAAAITLLAGSISFPSVSQGAENGLKKFDAQTTLWMDTCVEEVLGETAATTYGNLAEVNPNADSKNSSGHQNPYGKSGETGLIQNISGHTAILLVTDVWQVWLPEV